MLTAADKVERYIEKNGGTPNRAAAALGVSASGYYYRLKIKRARVAAEGGRPVPEGILVAKERPPALKRPRAKCAPPGPIETVAYDQPRDEGQLACLIGSPEKIARMLQSLGGLK